jgi:hypothetical protein
MATAGGDLQTYIGDYADDAAATAFLTGGTYNQARGYLYWDNTYNVLKIWNGVVWIRVWDPPPKQRSESLSTEGLAAGTYWSHGFYQAPAASASLSEVSTTQNYGTANVAYGAYAFIVASGPGSTDAGTVSIEVSGTSITDAGVRTAADTEVLVPDITTMATHDYFQTDKKWIGQITYTLVPAGGASTFNAIFNYGLAKYQTMGGIEFEVTDFEVTGLAGANDSAFECELLLHDENGWTYNGAAFVPGGTTIAVLNTDYGAEDQLGSGDYFSWVRNNLSQVVDSTGVWPDGVIVKVVVGQTDAVKFANIRIMIDPLTS